MAARRSCSARITSIAFSNTARGGPDLPSTQSASSSLLTPRKEARLARPPRSTSHCCRMRAHISAQRGLCSMATTDSALRLRFAAIRLLERALDGFFDLGGGAPDEVSRPRGGFLDEPAGAPGGVLGALRCAFHGALDPVRLVLGCSRKATQNCGGSYESSHHARRPSQLTL